MIWLGFADSVYPIEPPLYRASLGEASGKATRLRTAIEAALQAAGGRPVAGVVVVSDGRSPQDTGADLVRRLEGSRVGVYAVPVGAEGEVLDVSVARVEAPREVFVGDAVPVNVTVERSGGVAGDGGRVRVRLVEEATEGEEEGTEGRRDAGTEGEEEEGTEGRGDEGTKGEDEATEGRSDEATEGGEEEGTEGRGDAGTEGEPLEPDASLAEPRSASASFEEKEEEGGRVLDERILEADQLGRPVRLEGKGDAKGRARWRVEVEALPEVEGDPAPEEAIRQNNTRTVEVEVVDRPIRVLYVEGYPRWEYRYLKNLLIREDSIDASTLLLSADAAFAQEGDTPITRFPATGEELNQYDVVILGDFPPSMLGEEALGLLREQVAARGTGLLWIGGSRDMPVAWAGSAVEPLLPMREPGGVTPLRVWSNGLKMRPTRAASTLGVMELIRPASADVSEMPDTSSMEPFDAQYALWDWDVPHFLWAQDLGPLKPAAEVLGEIGERGGDMPMREGDPGYDEVTTPDPGLVRLRYGSGQSLYLATDETWRWRYGKGDPYFDQFWIGLVRTLGRARVQLTGGQAAVLQVRPREMNLGDTAIVELTVTDPELIDRNLPAIRVVVTPTASPGEKGSGVVSPSDAPDAAGVAGPIDQIDLRLEADAASDPALPASAPLQLIYRAPWQPTVSGELRLSVDEAARRGAGPQCRRHRGRPR